MTGRWTYLAPGASARVDGAAAARVWLVAADHLAIDAGIWRFGAGLHLGVHIGAVPIEEALFFLVTNLLVALGLALPAPGDWQ
jgi:lycopene cyclase domain-containing protein